MREEERLKNRRRVKDKTAHCVKKTEKDRSEKMFRAPRERTEASYLLTISFFLKS